MKINLIKYTKSRKILTISLIVLFLTSVFLMISPLNVNVTSIEEIKQPKISGGATWTVDNDGSANFNNIQEAIYAASSGDIIIVYPGIYTENVEVDKSLIIRSRDGAEATIVQATDSNYHVFQVLASYVDIDGFTIRGGNYGIYLYLVDGCNVLNNNITNNYIGIDSTNNAGHTISDNNLSNSYADIYFFYSANNIVTGNIMEKRGIWVSGASIYTHTQEIDTSNTVNGKPVYYWKEVNGGKIPLDAGQVILVDCMNVNVENLNLKETFIGIFVAFSSFITVKNNNCSQNSQYGIYFTYSSNGNIINNNCSDSYGGICLTNHAVNNTVRKNICLKNYNGIAIFSSSSHSNIIIQNHLSMNFAGIYLSVSTSGNTIIQNNFIDNTFAIRVAAPYTYYVYLNNFIQNTYNFAWVYPNKEGSPFWNSLEEINYIYNGNIYTNFLGNYWDDYTGSDVDGDGIGDIAYSIKTHEDRYPLMEPLENYFLILPSENQPPTLSNGYMDQPSGDTTTVFNYYITYTDPEGDAPTTKYVYIDGSPYKMIEISGDYISGAIFRYSTTLSAGSHNYYFDFDDGHGHSTRFPTSETVNEPYVNLDESGFVFGTAGGLLTLDPQFAWDFASYSVIDQVCEGLYAYDLSDPNLAIIPNLAAEHGIWSSNKLNYTVPLREDVTFHDGTPFNANAVKWSFDRLNYFLNATGELSAEVGKTILEELYVYKGEPIINRIEVINDYTVRFVLNEPYVPFQALLCFSGSYILSPALTPEKQYIDTTTGDLVGTGPFVFDGYTPDVEVRFHAFEDYWAGAPDIKTLVFSIIPDANERNQALLADNIDLITDPSFSMLDIFEADPDITVVEAEQDLTIYYLGMNNKQINKTMRQAISFAINYDSIIDEIMRGQSVRMKSPIPEGILYANWGFNVTTMNIGEARRRLVSGGVCNFDESSDEEWLNAAANNPLAIYNYTYNLGNYARENIGLLLQDNLAKIGIKVKLKGINWYDYVDRLFNFSDGHNKLQLYFIGWIADYIDPSNYINPLFSNTSESNTAQVNDPKLQGWMEQALTEFNPNIRQQLYNQIQQYLVEDLMPWAFCYVEINRDAYRSDIIGFQSNPMGRVRFYGVTRLGLNQPPTCVIELQKGGVKISDINVGEFFDIYVGDSTDDISIEQVRFSSDNEQDGFATGEWTEWYNWHSTSGDWNADTKIKRWAFATSGDKEVWAEIKDNAGQYDKNYEIISAKFPLIVISSPLEITPNTPYYVGDPLTATFNIKNIGGAPVNLGVLTVGGRDPDGFIIDFQWDRNAYLLPNDEYTYTGTLILPEKAGDYHFFCAYQNYYGCWNPSIDIVEDLREEDRIEDIFVFESKDKYPFGGIVIPEDIFPEGGGRIIPIYIPTLIDGTNIIREENGWITVKEINKAKINFEWEKFVTSFNPGRSETPQGGAIQSSYSFILAVDNSISIVRYNIVVQKSNEGNFRAIIQMGDPEENSFLRAKAGESTWFITDSLYWTIQRDISEIFAEAFHLDPDDYPSKYYSLSLKIDTSHKDDIYIGYLSLNQDGKIIFTPKIYPEDKFQILRKKHLFGGIYIYNTVREFTGDNFITFFKSSIGDEESKDILKILDPIYLVTDNVIIAHGKSPIDLHVFDSQGMITGIIDGQIKEQIPNSIYYDGTKIVVIFNPSDDYMYEIEGTDNGIYGLEIISIKDGEITDFISTDISITLQEIHKYSVNWDVLYQGDEGVTVNVDSDGDGVFEQNIIADEELTQDEFILQTETIVDFDPETLNLKSNGKWVSVYIELPVGFDINEIDLESIMLNDQVYAEPKPIEISDYDEDGIPDLTVKFNRTAVQEILEIGERVNIIITGRLVDGRLFKGKDIIQVIEKEILKENIENEYLSRYYFTSGYSVEWILILLLGFFGTCLIIIKKKKIIF